jgi:AcrR family transcriptional regulator
VTDTAVVELGRRERKKLETRRALAQEALRLALEHGPDNVTIEDIAEAADVSVRTFFNYFSSKEEAITNWDPEGRARIADMLLARPDDEPPFVAIRNVVRELIAGAEEWADQRAMRIQLVREHPSLLPRHLHAHHELERALLRAMAERLDVDVDASVYPALVVSSAVHAMRLSMTWWEAHGRKQDLVALVDEAFDALERGLTPPPTTRKKK